MSRKAKVVRGDTADDEPNYDSHVKGTAQCTPEAAIGELPLSRATGPGAM